MGDEKDAHSLNWSWIIIPCFQCATDDDCLTEIHPKVCFSILDASMPLY